MRKPTIDWEAYKTRLLALKYEEKKSLTDINKILYEQLGRCVTNARLSQVFTGWKREDGVGVVISGEDQVNAS